MDKKILLFDIETLPNLGYVWQKYEQNVLSYVKEWELASVSWKWLGEPAVFCSARPDFKDKTDKALAKVIWDLFNEAEIIIAHNGDQFDVKKSKAKFIEHGMDPPSTYKTVDTKKIAKAEFMFNSNSLNDLGKTLGLGQKVDTGGFQLWLDCIAGKKSAWDKMKKYNKQDVVLLEKVYLKMRPWAKTHPNISLLESETKFGCPNCGCQEYKTNGRRLMLGGWKTRMQCTKCGKWYAVNEKQRIKQEQYNKMAKD